MQHFESLLEFDSDRWDAHYAITNDRKDCVLLDIRGEAFYAKSLARGTVSLTHARINRDTSKEYSLETLFVVYCPGPHCNGMGKAAFRLANMGRPAKR